MNTYIYIALAWIFIGVLFESKMKYRKIRRGLHHEHTTTSIALIASHRSWWQCLFGPICILDYCFEFGAPDREGYCNPFESETRLLSKLEEGWAPKSLLCYFGIHDYSERFSVFNIPLQPGKLSRENALHTTDYCRYCPEFKKFQGSHILALDRDFVLLKSNSLNPSIVHRIYDMYDNGIMPSGIAKELNLSKTTVHKYLDLRNSN